MRNNLLICFLLFLNLGFSQSERELISQIDSINKAALNYYNINDMLHSIDSFNEAIKLSDSIDDSYGNVIANFTLGKIYSYIEEYNDAENCFQKMLAEAQQMNDNLLIAYSYLSLGEVYRNKKQISNVIPYFKNALIHAQKESVSDQNNFDELQNILFNIRMSLCAAYLDLEDPAEALLYLLRARKNLDNAPYSIYNEGLVGYMFGRYFVQKEMLLSANEKFKEAENILKTHDQHEDYECNELLSKIFKAHSKSLAALDQPGEAYDLLLKHNIFRERVINEEKVKQENIAKSKFYNAEYKRVARMANNERFLQEQAANKMQRINIFISLGILLLLVSFFTLYKNFLSKQKLSTILKAHNKQLEVARDQAEKSSRLKSKFISNVTHELRTPLYGVVGLTSILLKSRDISEKDSKFIRSLKFSGDYLLNLINDILQVGKIESGKVELQLTSVNLRLLIENIIDSFEYRSQESNNEIVISIDENLPEFIKCDNVRLSQVLINLIGNSIKFTQNGMVWLSIEVLEIVDENVRLRFVVKDNGTGIPKDQQERIFENFSQVNEKNHSQYQGTGLGLSIAKHLVGLFGSKIDLVSELGVGSEFSFNVSFEIDNDMKPETPANNDISSSLQVHEKYKILVAEDNRINQIVTQNVLQKGNFDCEIVENGLEALHAVRDENSYDLVLMDLNMPIMNGVEAVKEIRKINEHIPVIALTAADIEEVKKDYSNMGFNDIVTKPFDNFEFYQKITACIQQSQQNTVIDETLFRAS
jgi:signal transduction histidine kinase/CheY-like chemotaxis protein